MSFWKSIERKAKKKHYCAYCGKTIKPGEVYSRETGIYEGQFDDYCLCVRCREALTYFKDTSFGDYELGHFVNDLFESDMLECPQCHRCNHRDYEFSEDMDSINLQCDECEHYYIVDLSLDSIVAHFGSETV